MAVFTKILFWTVVAVAPGGVLLLPFLLAKRKKAEANQMDTASRQA